MQKSYLEQSRVEHIRRLPHLADGDPPSPSMLLWENTKAALSCYYAPFEYLNPDARLILVRITPGGTQMNRALNAARGAITRGLSITEAVKAVKTEGSFSGAMRPNLVNTLNRLGFPKKLDIACASELWKDSNHLVHFCSLLKFPVFVKGKDYSGSPKVHKTAELRTMLMEHFVPDLGALPHDAMLVPLGDTVLEVLVWLKEQDLVRQEILKHDNKYVAPPHPSGANAESIALLLERNYPDQTAYANSKYVEYLKQEPWKKKTGGKPQPESKYKAARVSRWKSMLAVRKAYDVD